MKDAKVTIKRVEDKGQYKTRVTIEILNPVPETAKFFGYSIVGTEIQVCANPEAVTLDGSYNKVSKKFSSEKDGREWADSILKAVVKKGKEALNKDKVVIDVDLYYQHGDYSYLPSVEKLDGGQTKPSCFGNWRCFKVGWCDCPFNSKETSKPNCFGKYKAENKKCSSCFSLSPCYIYTSPMKIPGCFGGYKDCQYFPFEEFRECPFISSCEDQKKTPTSILSCVPNCFRHYNNALTCLSHNCSFLSSCKEQSKEKKKPNCFTTYDPDNEGCKFCDEDVESCKEETKDHLLVTRWYNGDIDLVTNLTEDQASQAYFELYTYNSRKIETLLLGKVVKCYQDSDIESESPDEKMADVMIKKGMNWRLYHNIKLRNMIKVLMSGGNGKVC